MSQVIFIQTVNDMNRLIICIGRQTGAGGRRVAARLSELLSIPVYDHELVTEAARESGFSASLFRKSDEKRHFSMIGSLFGSNRYGHFNSNAISEGELFKLQSEAIRRLADGGSCIFVGRAADYVLRDRDDLVSLFLTADLPDRIAAIAGREQIGEKEAEAFIRKNDKMRRDFYTFGRWGDAAQYDLCLNTSRLGIDAAADLVVTYARMRGLL